MKNIIKNIKRIAMIPIMVATLYNCGDFSKKPELSYEQKLKIEQEKQKLTSDSLAIDSYFKKRISKLNHEIDSLRPSDLERKAKEKELNDGYNEMIKIRVNERIKQKGLQNDIEQSAYGTALWTDVYNSVKYEIDQMYGPDYIEEKMIEWERYNSKNIVWQRLNQEEVEKLKDEYKNFRWEFSKNPAKYRGKFLNKK